MPNIATDSRYVNQIAPTIAYSVVQTGELYWGTRVPISLIEDSTDRWVRPRPGERWDQFAYRIYSPSMGDRANRLWWILCDLNDVVNPLKLPDPRQLYRAPSADRVTLEILG